MIEIKNHLPAGTAAAIHALVEECGSGAHPYVRSSLLRSGPDAARNLTDAVHYLTVLHGRLPSVVDLAGMKVTLAQSKGWLAEAATGFALERTYLTRLVVAAGPLPSTAGQADSEAAVVAQHHAVEMLARSERTGCAAGAAIGLVMDWAAVRPVLDAAADRFGLPRMECQLPEPEATAAFVDEIAETPGIERAVRFGVEQILVQHTGLWNLLESREHARQTQ
jgi:hypothetical protein